MTTLAVWTGTLILFLPTPHGAYVTADSRHDGGPAAEADQARKIFLCGPDAVCAISGSLRVTVTRPTGEATTFDVAGTLERAAKSLDAGADAETVAQAIQSELGPFWEKHLSDPVASPLSSRTLARSVSTILFARRVAESGEMQLAQIQFPFHERQDAGGGWLHELRPPVIHAADAARPLAQGKTECMGIRPDEPPDVETRESTLAAVRILYERTQADAYCRTIIGGPVDVAVIDAGGPRWLARK
jgi:hypothetical protein